MERSMSPFEGGRGMKIPDLIIITHLSKLKTIKKHVLRNRNVRFAIAN